MKNYKDLQGNVHALDDVAFEHLLPDGCVKITQAEADAILNPPKTLAQLQAEKSAVISSAAQASIVGGFTSSALGVSNTYPTTLIDQQNINAVALFGGSLWCADATGKWYFVSHTKTQAVQVQADMVTWIQAQQAKNAAKQEEIKTAKTVADVELVVW